MSRTARSAFTLAECVLALALLTMILLTLVGTTISSLRASEKSALLGPATQVSDSLMNRTLYQVANDLPAGSNASFWGAAGLWRGPIQETIGGVNYEYVIYANTVLDAAGGPLGGAIPNNRVKKVDIRVWWWEARSNNGTRQGYGKMEVQASRLVEEHAP